MSQFVAVRSVESGWVYAGAAFWRWRDQRRPVDPTAQSPLRGRLTISIPLLGLFLGCDGRGQLTSFQANNWPLNIDFE